MPKRDEKIIFEDILEAINKIEKYTAGMIYQKFVNDDKTTDAVIRNLEIIGEASNQLSEETQEKYNEIIWHQIIGLRNRVIHVYFGVDTEIIWDVIINDLPDFKIKIEKMIKSL